jgi:uncharacterized protein
MTDRNFCSPTDCSPTDWRVTDRHVTDRGQSRRQVLLAALTASAAAAFAAAADTSTALAGADLAAAGLADDRLAEKLIAAALTQVGVTTHYDAAYVRLAFPGGDVAAERGVCTDVIVRAYRTALGFDLQVRLNVDMRAAFAVYPRRWGLNQPDSNIDHRRVPNLQMYFARQGAERARPNQPADWQPGDLVTQMIPGGRPHIGIVSAQWNADTSRRLIIHNIGRGTQVEDVLDLFPITGRYRFLPKT